MPRRLLCVGVLAVLALAVLLPLLARARETVPPKASVSAPKSSAAETTRISDIIIQGNQRLTTEQIKAHLRTQVGRTYNPTALDDDVRDLFKTQQFSNIRTVIQKDGPGKVKIFFLFRDLPRAVQQAKEPALARVGQVFIIGNKTVSQDSILAHVPLFPGQILKYPDLKEAERNLAKLGVFVVDPAKGIQPTITVLDAEGSVFKDIRITVKEKPQTKPAGNKP